VSRFERSERVASADGCDWHAVAARLFPNGHDIVEHGDLLAGTGRCGPHPIAVIGTTRHVETGVEIALAMAARVLATIREHPGRALLFLIDTQGQRLRLRDELLGIHRYLAHLAACVEVARTRGHAVLGLVYDQALSGGILTSAMSADVCGALPEAEIRVMNLTAMARVTRLSEARLRELAQASLVFAPGAINYVTMGAVDKLWDGDLAQCLEHALDSADPRDRRAERGFQRGGRTLAWPVAQRVAHDG
jgi:malonate decarboxylase gamma subunit